ncbi:MAG: MFS transporter, partial [Bacteroidales bacterium]|nr:MFS transporter [Bacteroidales bacterium]
NSIRGGAAAYYFANILGTNIFITCAVFLTIGEIGQMIGVTLAVPLSERIGKKNAFMLSLATVAVLSCIIWFLPATTGGVWTLLVLQVLISIIFGISAPLVWSMFADVADYSELKTGSNSTGLIFSSSSMAQKFGGAIGGFLLLMILGAFGYNKDLVEQAPQTLGAIKALMSFIPAIGAALGLLALSFYPLTSSRMRQIQADLKERRNAE